MADKSSIEWTDATWNPVTGCTEVSPGCDRCYAKTFAERWRGTSGHYFENGFDVQLRPDKLNLPRTWRKPRKVFVNSMSDLFHDSVPDHYIADVFAVMAGTPQHTYQVLTKRHGRMRSLLKKWSPITGIPPWTFTGPWPLPNVWLGVSVENQQWADIRIRALAETPAAKRFLSCEPLLGPIEFHQGHGHCPTHDFAGGGCISRCPDLVLPDWVIVGGESGHGARPMHPDWARSIRDWCVQAGVPFLFKQWGEWGPAPWSVRVCDPAVGWQGTKDELAAAKRDAEARGATHLIQPWGHLYEPDHKPWSLERDPDSDHYPGAIRRWGKKAAGRELDGRTWDEFPEVSRG